MYATRKWAAALACALTIGAQEAKSAGQYAYVASFEANAVSVIDTTSNSVIATIPVGSGPFGVASTPDGRFVYVTNSGANSVSVIDTSSNAVVATVAVGGSPLGVAVTPDGRFAYALMAGDGSVYAISTATNTVSVAAPIGMSTPVSIAFAPDGRKAYITAASANTVSVLDPATNSVTASVPVGAFPFDAAVTPDGRFAYVANLASPATEAVSVIDAAGNAVVANVALDDGSQGVAIHPDGRFVYVAHSVTNSVSVVDTATNARVASISVGLNPLRIALTPDGRFAYVTNQDSGSVSVVDTASNAVIASVAVGTIPQGVAIATLRSQDTSAPATTAATTPPANAAGWSNAPVTVTLTAADEKDGSGVKSVAYTLTGAVQGGGQAAGATSSFAISTDGLTTVTYRATDNAGNVEAAKTLALRIDRTAPASTAIATPPADSTGASHGPVTIKVAATDNGSGVQSISVVRGSGTETFPGGAASIIVSTPGVTTLTYRATDIAGNVEAPKTLTVRIEAAAALSAKVSVWPPVLWPVDRRFDEVHPSFKVAHAVGRTKVKAVSVTSDEAVGRTSPDWIVKGSSVKLRAERDDRGNGRVYTITYTLVDEAGNTAQASDTVAVPKHFGWHWNRHYSRWDRD